MAAFSGESSASLDNLLARLKRDEFDLIAVGRALLADPAWVKKVHARDEKLLGDFTKEALAKLY